LFCSNFANKNNGAEGVEGDGVLDGLCGDYVFSNPSVDDWIDVALHTPSKNCSVICSAFLETTVSWTGVIS